MVRITPGFIAKPWSSPHLEGVPRCPILRGRKLTMVMNHLQVIGWSSKNPLTSVSNLPMTDFPKQSSGTFWWDFSLPSTGISVISLSNLARIKLKPGKTNFFSLSWLRGCYDLWEAYISRWKIFIKSPFRSKTFHPRTLGEAFPRGVLSCCLVFVLCGVWFFFFSPEISGTPKNIPGSSFQVCKKVRQKGRFESPGCL